MKIIKGDRDDQYRCIGPGDMLIGLITKVRAVRDVDVHWRIELFMRIECKADNELEALAFARGCWATCEAFNVGMRPRAEPMQIPTVEKK